MHHPTRHNHYLASEIIELVCSLKSFSYFCKAEPKLGRHIAKVFSYPSQEMWKFSNQRAMNVLSARALILRILFSWGYSISSRVWSIS